MKTCRICGQSKPLAEFQRHAKTRDGLRHECRACRTAEMKRYRQANPEATKAYNQRYAAEHPEIYRDAYRRWKKRNRARATDWQRDWEARELGLFVECVDGRVVLEQSEGLCGICGDPVDPSDFHVDHIVPLSCGGEHSYANTQAAHPYCNRSKRNRPMSHPDVVALSHRKG